MTAPCSPVARESGSHPTAKEFAGSRHDFWYTPATTRRRSRHLSSGNKLAASADAASALTIKAKLEAIESRIETFGLALMPHVASSGKTVSERVLPALEATSYHN